MSRETSDPFILTADSRVQIDGNNLSTPLPVRLRPSALSSPPKRSAQFCCCCPVALGVWILLILLVTPSLALVLCFNIANLQAYIQFNAPAPVKFVYTGVYVIYALLGLTMVIVLHKVAPHQRFKSLIALYWVLIAMTILEGIYFGTVMSKQKSKFVSDCDDNLSLQIPEASNGTVIAAEVNKDARKPPHQVVCQNNHSLVGVFYILGPGGWIMLHIGWVLFVVLYSKALRKMYPTENDEEEGFAPGPPSRVILAFPPAPVQQKQAHVQARPKSSFLLGSPKPFQANHGIGKDKDLDLTFSSTMSNASRRFSAGLSNTGPFWQASKSNASHNTSVCMNSMSSIDANDTLENANFSNRHEPDGSEADEYSSDEDDDRDQDRFSNLSTPRRSRQEGGTHSTDGSASSRTEIPADGKGWWIRQIEGKRRGEICPCTLGNPVACWCGRERRTSHTRGLSDSQGSSSCAANTSTQVQDKL